MGAGEERGLCARTHRAGKMLSRAEGARQQASRNFIVYDFYTFTNKYRSIFYNLQFARFGIDVFAIDSMASFEQSESLALPFKYLPEEFDWSDVVPIPQNDGPDPVVTIAYTDECKYP